jgi:hypothetical protein
MPHACIPTWFYCDTDHHQCSTSHCGYSTLKYPSWWHGILPAVQSDLLSVATPTKVSIGSSTKPWELIPIRVKPLSHIPTITTPTALRVDMFSPAHQRCPRVSVIIKYKLSNISDEYSIPRQMHSAAQCEVQTRAGNCRKEWTTNNTCWVTCILIVSVHGNTAYGV